MKKLFIYTTIVFSLMSNVYAANISENISDVVTETKGEEITRGVYYKYKYINGVKYKRLWSDELGWLEDEWTPA